jgi:hypothetical protein
MKCSPRRSGGWRERLLKLPFYGVAGTIKFTAEMRSNLSAVAAESKKNFESKISSGY